MKKILVNLDFGGFGLKDEYNDYGGREDEKLIALVEQGIDIGDELADIGNAEVPDNATDYYINEYDGKEEVLYVLDGRIYFAKCYQHGEEY